MLGAIVGDIVGSVYEWNNIKTKDFPLFRKDCFFTDDTVMTCAVAEAVMNGGKKDDFIDAMKNTAKCTRMPVMAEDSIPGCSTMTGNLITALATVRPCVCLPAGG